MQHRFLSVWLDAAGIQLFNHICANTYGHSLFQLRAQVCAPRCTDACMRACSSAGRPALGAYTWVSPARHAMHAHALTGQRVIHAEFESCNTTCLLSNTVWQALSSTEVLARSTLSPFA